MQPHTQCFAKMTEIITLQDHVVEFQESHRLFALKPELYRIECQHAVDSEMRSDLLQQFNISKLAKPIMVVDHDCVGRTIAKFQKLPKTGPD